MSKLVDENTLQATVGTIREAVDNRISTSREDLAKIDKTTNKVLPDQLPMPVVRFDGCYKLGTLTITPQSVVGAVQVIYYSKNKTFVALKDGKYYNNWETRSEYTPTAGGQPYTDRLYLSSEDNNFYAFLDTILKSITSFENYASKNNVYDKETANLTFLKSSEISYMTAAEAQIMVQNAFANNNE